MAEHSDTRMSAGMRGISLPLVGALTAGGALAIYGISRRSPLTIAIGAGVSGTFAVLSARRRRGARRDSVWTTILINCSPDEAYRFWQDFENLPRFMRRLQSVTVLDERRSRWIALGPGGRQIQWESEITSERQNETIAWRSLPGSDVQVEGEVRFEEAPAGRGTLVSLRIEYSAVPGMPSALAKFLRKGINFALRQDLRRLENIMEAGEIPTTEGQPHGPRDKVTAALRTLDPTRPGTRGSELGKALESQRSIA